mgnify:CR=1 FL=1
MLERVVELLITFNAFFFGNGPFFVAPLISVLRVADAAVEAVAGDGGKRGVVSIGAGGLVAAFYRLYHIGKEAGQRRERMVGKADVCISLPLGLEPVQPFSSAKQRVRLVCVGVSEQDNNLFSRESGRIVVLRIRKV